jgi:hypothetical protein
MRLVQLVLAWKTVSGTLGVALVLGVSIASR